mmetsp:Transcript_39915/g.100271  ORF Transcript_39915/g.100271 Transcript_39915/m.100271 type:complete len:213 (-) Transcript_39915:345-983(-)
MGDPFWLGPCWLPYCMLLPPMELKLRLAFSLLFCIQSVYTSRSINSAKLSMMLCPLCVHCSISSALIVLLWSLSISLKMFSVALLSSMGCRAEAFSGIMAFKKGFKYSFSSFMVRVSLLSWSRMLKTALTHSSVEPLKKTEHPPAHSPVLSTPLLSKSMESKISYNSSLSFALHWMARCLSSFTLFIISQQTSTNCSLVMWTPGLHVKICIP